MPESISVRIDGEYLQARAGQTILEVARAGGKYIPTLCWLENLSAVGACRLCVVEAAGVGRLLPACTTPAQDGMSVVTVSEKLTAYRRMIVELLLSERNHHCAVCVSNEHCELQALAQRVGVTNVRFPYSFPKLPVDLSHPRYTLDHNRCILCTRCVRVCGEVEGARVWDVSSRGVRSMIVAEMNRPWGESRTCTNCGKCVQVCPTGALAEKGYAVCEMVKQDRAVKRVAGRRGARI